MTKEEVNLVKKSWRIFQQINPELVGDVFYGNLFAAHPALRKMFPADMHAQYQKLVDMISSIVQRLDRLHLVETDIIELAQRHVEYGVRPAHYAMVGKALIITLEQGLGRDWTPAMANAWQHCYQTLASAMLTAAYGDAVN